jgi:hypothetical protein
MKIKKESTSDKILEAVLNIEGFTAIVCFLVAPLMGVITEKDYVGVVIFLIGLAFYGVHYITNLPKK